MSYFKLLKDPAKNTALPKALRRKVSRERLTLVFLRQRERLRYRETLRSLNAFRSSPKPSLGNFLRAYWYLWAASFIFPFWRTHGGQTCSEEEDRTRRKKGTRHSPDTPPQWLFLWLKPSLLINHTQSSSKHTHTPGRIVLSTTKLNLLNVRHRSRLLW